MKKKAEILRLDVVLLGDFNPKIFTPAWFSSLDLIGEKEADEAKVELIHQDVSIFNLDWCRIQVTRDRFSIFTEQEVYFTKLIDLVTQTFTCLNHTPLRAIGANWGGHYKSESEKEWHQFGYFLAPKSPWDKIFKESAMAQIEIMEENQVAYSATGNMRVRVSASNELKHGIFINVNDHYELEPDAKRFGCKDIINAFEQNRENSYKKFELVVNTLFKNFEGVPK